MKIYFVRHGSTNQYENWICQSDNEPLSQKGKLQAKELATRFKDTQLDLIISSPHARTLETAQAISSDVITSDLFIEGKKPSEFVGGPMSDEKFLEFKKMAGEMYFTNPTWHYSDEENFEDLKKRGLKALNFLTSQNKEDILVVSHANFIALMIGLMLFGKDFPVEISLKLKNFLRLSNTGVTICTYNENKWQLHCWNDTSHRLE
jgi:broad specificity phosphatase PhoE